MLFSAAYRAAGNAHALFEIARPCGATLATSPFAVDEALRNLRLKAPEGEAELVRLLGRLERLASPDRHSLERAQGHGLPDKDIPILAAALAVRARILVTGDRRHFGLLFGKRIEGLEVLSPLESLDRLLRRSASY